MPKLRILITMPPPPPPDASLYEDLRRDPELEITLVSEPSGGHGLDQLNWPSEWLRDKDVIFCSGVFPANFRECNALRWVQMGSAGYEQAIDVKAGEHNGGSVRVSNGLGTFDVPIAEWNVMMILALARDLRGMIRNQERGAWDRDRRFQREVRGSTVGFWGYGGLSRETARLVKHMGMKVHVLVRGGVKKRHHYLLPGTGDPEGKLPDRVFDMTPGNPGSKREFLAGLDFLIIGVPQTPSTIGMIGEDDLESLPRHACLLNPARGPLIQEQALLRALREKWIAGAALDAHYHYPMPPEHPLWHMPNVIMTPHISGSGETPSYLPRAWDIFTQNLRRFRAGEPLLNELSREQLRGE
jgi:phosphoglycerate dehydrogenase-like enzyme